MQYSPVFHVIALDAQRREFALAGPTGPTVEARPAGRLRTALTRGLSVRGTGLRTHRRPVTV